MNNSKVAIAVSKIVSFIQILGGIILLFLFGVSLIIGIVDKVTIATVGWDFLIICLVFVGIGVWLIILSRKKTKLTKEFKKYVAVISQNPSGYIPDIAASLGIAEDVVKNNMNQMIYKKFFSNAYIDRNSNCIVIVNEQPAQADLATTNAYANAAAAPTYAAAPAVEMVTVKCRGCGGINTIAKGQPAQCDFCGSAIKSE